MKNIEEKNGDKEISLKEFINANWYSFDKNVKRLYLNFGENTKSIVNRLGLITFRISAILSIIRQLDAGKLEKKILCEDVDFQTSMLLSEVYLEHAMDLFQIMEKKPKVNKTAELLLDFLPEQFSFSEAVMIGYTNGDIPPVLCIAAPTLKFHVHKLRLGRV